MVSRSSRMTVLAAAALFAAVLAPTVAPPAALAAAAKCPDMIVSASDLDEILNQTLGSYRDLVDQHKVVIDPANSACYVRFTLGSTHPGAGVEMPCATTALRTTVPSADTRLALLLYVPTSMPSSRELIASSSVAFVVETRGGTRV